MKRKAKPTPRLKIHIGKETPGYYRLRHPTGFGNEFDTSTDWYFGERSYSEMLRHLTTHWGHPRDLDRYGHRRRSFIHRYGSRGIPMFLINGHPREFVGGSDFLPPPRNHDEGYQQ